MHVIGGSVCVCMCFYPGEYLEHLPLATSSWSKLPSQTSHSTKKPSTRGTDLADRGWIDMVKASRKMKERNFAGTYNLRFVAAPCPSGGCGAASVQMARCCFFLQRVSTIDPFGGTMRNLSFTSSPETGRFIRNAPGGLSYL